MLSPLHLWRVLLAVGATPGALQVHLMAPDGSPRRLAWGPDAHGEGTFHRPGDEWGIGFSFDAPGCWQIAFERKGGDRADFWFDVGA